MRTLSSLHIPDSRVLVRVAFNVPQNDSGTMLDGIREILDKTGDVIGTEKRPTHLSTGGGVFLDYLAHGSLPALDALKEG